MVKINIADIRQEYTKGGLRENELPGDPLSLFSRWLQEAIDAEVVPFESRSLMTICR